MSAITTSPAWSSAGGSTSGILGDASVTVIAACTAWPTTCDVSAERPLGRSIDTTGTSSVFRSATTVSSRPGERRLEPGADDRVDHQTAAAHLRRVQLPRLLVGHLHGVHAQPPQDVQVQPRVAGDVGHRAEDEHRHVHAALGQGARHHEAVAAVVAAAAQHRDAAVEQILVVGLERRHHLAAGVLHQHDRRQAQVVDGLPVGFAHLRGVEDSHCA